MLLGSFSIAGTGKLVRVDVRHKYRPVPEKKQLKATEDLDGGSLANKMTLDI